MRILYARGDDWEGIYFNDVLYDEGHTLRLGGVLRALDGQVMTSFEEKFVNLDWLAYLGSLPGESSEIIWEGEPWEDPWKDTGLELDDATHEEGSTR